MAGIKSLHLLLFGRFLAQMIIIDAEVESIIVFGDSTVDSVNNNYVPTVLKRNFKPYGRDFYGSQPTGRFCNSRIVTDFISEAYGIRDIVPGYLDSHYNISDFAKGVSFASAGTGFDNLTAAILDIMFVLAGFAVGERACCATGRFEMSYLCNKFNSFTCKDADNICLLGFISSV